MRIGILGGTFNPIHNGHLGLARQSSRSLRLDKVIFVPVSTPPHKQRQGLAPAKYRFKMVSLAIKPYPCFEVSDYEIRTGGTSYSAKTLGAFRKIYGKAAKLFFLTGSDSLEQLKSWKNLGNILKLAVFVVAKRPGYKMAGAPAFVKPISIKPLDISSTDIRRRLKKGLSVRGLLPGVVHAYINKKRLYR